jgi:hypothetical protein
MKKLYLLNNIVVGMVLVAIWFADYFYFRRAVRKLSRNALLGYDSINSKIFLRTASEIATAKELSQKYAYRPNDTYYVDFVNFHKISDDQLQRFSALLKQVYQHKFKDAHEATIYFRVMKVPKSDLNAYIQKGRPIFKGAHLSSQNFYHIKLINDDFENRFNIKGNSVSMLISSHKLAESDIFQKIISKSIYHLKHLNGFERIKDINFKSKDAFERLREVYYFLLRYRAMNHIAALRYINKNKNLVFKQPYLQELEEEPPLLTDSFREKKLVSIYQYLRKADLAIYDTVYFYEEY